MFSWAKQTLTHIAAVDYDFARLRDGFSGDIVLPSDADYDKSLTRWSRLAQLKAGAVAFVKSPEDVAHVLQIATSHQIPVVIRGGGHSSGGASSTNGGLVIDLSRYLNSVRVDAEKKLAYIGGGSHWKQVDEETIKYGLATVGATINDTGVGGFVLGGGFGFLTGAYGLAIDNLEEVALVTAAGEVLKASASSNPDLFWGVRGGGCNFGVVTEFVLRLHPQSQTVYAGPIIFPPPLLQPVVTAMDNWLQSNPDDSKASANFIFGRGPDGSPCIIASVFYNGTEEEGRKHFKFLFDIGPVADLSATVPYDIANSLSNRELPPGPKYVLGGTTRMSLPAATAQVIFDKFVAESSLDPRLNGLVVIWEFLPFGKKVSVAPDATAFRARVPASGAILCLKWDTPGDEFDADAIGVFERFLVFTQTELDKSLQGPKLKDDTGYGNFENSTESSNPAQLFGENYGRLQELKRRYDPDLVFNKWFPIAPA